jgi:hypothetical protein
LITYESVTEESTQGYGVFARDRRYPGLVRFAVAAVNEAGVRGDFSPEVEFGFKGLLR